MATYWGDAKSIPSPKALSFKESLLVLGKLLSDPGCDIMMGQDINMRDSISMKMLKQPCRALGCKHIQCFDFEAYLHVNKSRPASEYSCPVCNQVSNPSKIYIDTIFLCLLKLLPEDSNISIMKDGQFDIRVNKPPREIIVVDDDDDEGDFVATTSISSGITQCTGSVVELSYIVPFTTSKSKKNLTSLAELTTASLDDVLHLMNVENAWGVNSIPGSTMELQKCIRAKRPFASNSNDGLKYLLQQVDGVGAVRASKIVEHFYKILQSKLTSYLEFIEARSLFKENALNLSLSSPIVVEFLKKTGRLKPIGAPVTIGSTAKAEKDTRKVEAPVSAQVLPISVHDCDVSQRERAGSIISVASSAYECELESEVQCTGPNAGSVSLSNSGCWAERAVLDDNAVHRHSAAAMRAKSSSAVCGDGIADVAVLPKLTRRQSSGSIAPESDVPVATQARVIDLSDDSHTGNDAHFASPIGSPSSSSPTKRRNGKRRRSEDSGSVDVAVAHSSSCSSSSIDMVMEIDPDVVTVSSASMQPEPRRRRRRVGVVDVDAEADAEDIVAVRGPSSAAPGSESSCAATVSSTSSAEVSARRTPAPAPVVNMLAAASMSRAAAPMQAVSSSSDTSALRRPHHNAPLSTAVAPSSSSFTGNQVASSPSAARPRTVGNVAAGATSPQGRSRSNSVMTAGSGTHIRFQEEEPQPTRSSPSRSRSAEQNTVPFVKAAFPKRAISSIAPLTMNLLPAEATISVQDQQQPQPQQRYHLVNNNRRLIAPRSQAPPIVIPSVRAALSPAVVVPSVRTPARGHSWQISQNSNADSSVTPAAVQSPVSGRGSSHRDNFSPARSQSRQARNGTSQSGTRAPSLQRPTPGDNAPPSSSDRTTLKASSAMSTGASNSLKSPQATSGQSHPSARGQPSQRETTTVAHASPADAAPVAPRAEVNSHKVFNPNSSWVRPQADSAAARTGADQRARSQDSRSDSRERFPKTTWCNSAAEQESRARQEYRHHENNANRDRGDRPVRSTSRENVRVQRRGLPQSTGTQELGNRLPVVDPPVTDEYGPHSKAYIIDNHRYPQHTMGYNESLRDPANSRFRTERVYYPQYDKRAQQAPESLYSLRQDHFAGDPPAIAAQSTIHAQSRAPPPSDRNPVRPSSQQKAAAPAVPSTTSTVSTTTPVTLGIVHPPPVPPSVPASVKRSSQSTVPHSSTTRVQAPAANTSQRSTNTTSPPPSFAKPPPSSQLARHNHTHFEDGNTASTPQETLAMPSVGTSCHPAVLTHAPSNAPKSKAKINSKLDTAAVLTRPGGEVVHRRTSWREAQANISGCSVVTQQSFAGLMTQHFSTTDTE